MAARILILDDRSTNLRIYSQYVSMMGSDYETVCFRDPLEALSWLGDNSADLLIVDYRMPVMNGAEFIATVRQKSAGLQCPAIIITARQDRECRISALDAGATDFLQSPVTSAEFKDRALTLIEQHQKKRELSEHQFARAEIQLREHAEHVEYEEPTTSLLSQIMDTTPIMLVATDRTGHILFLNAYNAALIGRETNDLIGKRLSDYLDAGVASREFERNAAVIKQGISINNVEERIVTDGIELVFLCNKSPLRNLDGEIIGVLTSGIDITARKFAEEHRAHLALHDLLTGLPNRALLGERIRETVAYCIEQSEPAALLLLDLDRFKVINDTRGHQAGDALLRQVAERLNDMLGPRDFASRIGGDEFALLLRGCDGFENIARRCDALLNAIRVPFSVENIDQLIGCSIGIARIPGDGTDPDELLRMADLAMYDAKAKGKDGYSFFSPELNQIAQSGAILETQLRAAIEREEFFLEFQPIVNVQTKEISGLEALIRWEHPDRGRLLPASFLRTANETGLIDQIGRQVLILACKQIAKFREAGVIAPPIAINVSPSQFHAIGMSQEILHFIRHYDVPAGKLDIEITEELLLDKNQQVLEQLELLKAQGIGISIDDFGTGYSSLQYLRDIPANKLKIDRAFVARMQETDADRAIVATIVHLAHALGMRVVAEGVENGEQLSLLRAANCDEVQGYFIAKPMAANRLFTILGQGQFRFDEVA